MDRPALLMIDHSALTQVTRSLHKLALALFLSHVPQQPANVINYLAAARIGLSILFEALMHL